MPALLSEAQRDIDVLFFGTYNPSRGQVYQALMAAGVNVTWPDDFVFGPALTELLKRAKVRSSVAAV